MPADVSTIRASAYKSLASRPNPTPNGPAVDYRRNRFYQATNGSWVDNRSGLEQAIELLGYADCGFIGCSQGSLSTSCAAAKLPLSSVAAAQLVDSDPCEQPMKPQSA